MISFLPSQSWPRLWPVALMLCAFLNIATEAIADPSEYRVEEFFSQSIVVDEKLSPDGNFIATIDGLGRKQLVVEDLNTKAVHFVASFSDVDVTDFHWVNNERLVFSVADPQAPGDIQYWPGLFAINRDGSDPRTLVERTPAQFVTNPTLIKKTALPGNTFYFDSDRSGKSDDIFVVQTVMSNTYEVEALNLMRVNTKTGRAQTIDRPHNTVNWLIDQNGEPRISVSLHEAIEEISYLDPATDKWRKIAEFSIYDGTGFQPKYFGPDGTLYVVARNGKDKSALYRYDLVENRLAQEPVLFTKDYDIDESLVENGYFDDEFIVSQTDKKLLGVRYQTDAWATFWFDEEMKNIQKKVDELLPHTVNMLSVGQSGNTKKVLVQSFSDVHPTFYVIYDSVSNKIVPIGVSRVNIVGKDMALQKMVRYEAGDGLEIPAYLSLPRKGAQNNLPLIVLVHGGPYVRGNTWGWDPEVQFLASRGYAVLQPEFRGSTGFGTKHFQAGWKQWGLAMQDDIADGARWAIKQGIADPKRICIAGASYGGYAALMGLAKNPELFKCGIDWLGVTDINLMFESDWSSDMSEEWQRFGMPILIGDRIKDAKQLQETSPVNIANRIKQPLLLAYGGADHRVPITHGKKFRDAVREFNKDVEWVEYPDEGHGWALLKDSVDFWTRVEKFLDKNIGKQE